MVEIILMVVCRRAGKQDIKMLQGAPEKVVLNSVENSTIGIWMWADSPMALKISPTDEPSAVIPVHGAVEVQMVQFKGGQVVLTTVGVSRVERQPWIYKIKAFDLQIDSKLDGWNLLYFQSHQWMKPKFPSVDWFNIPRIEGIPYSTPLTYPPSGVRCVICIKFPATMLNMTCGHLAMCFDCSAVTISAKCVVCRATSTVEPMFTTISAKALECVLGEGAHDPCKPCLSCYARMLRGDRDLPVSTGEALKLCGMCHNRPPCTILLPCKHMFRCSTCFGSKVDKDCVKCKICSAKVNREIKMFFN